MAFTETKRKYLLTIALLGPSPSQPFRPIDLAVRLGVSRASVSRMLLAFVKEGVLTQKEHTYQLSPQGLTQIKDALSQYAICHAYCTRVLQLSDGTADVRTPLPSDGDAAAGQTDPHSFSCIKRTDPLYRICPFFIWSAVLSAPACTHPR